MSASLDYGLGLIAIVELDVYVNHCLKSSRRRRQSRLKEQKQLKAKDKQQPLSVNAFFAKNPNCYWCGIKLDKDNRSRDHFVPISKGGSSDWSNIVAACKPCNNKKGDELPDAYLCRLRKFGQSRAVKEYSGKGNER